MTEPREDARRPKSGDRVRGYGHTHVKPEERLPDGTEGIYRRRSAAGDGALWVEVGGQWRHFTRVEPVEPREDAVANSKPAPSSAKTWRNEREDAVEALYVAVTQVQGLSINQCGAVTDAILAVLDRGAVPGYGPTGDRTGEVTNRQGCSVKMQHDQHVWRGYTGTSWLCGGRQTSDTP